MIRQWQERNDEVIAKSDKVVDTIQVILAAKGETDRPRLIRLSNVVNAKLKNLTKEEHGFILKDISEIEVLNKMQKVKGRIDNWDLAR